MNKQTIFQKHIDLHNKKLSFYGYSSKTLWNSKESQFIRFNTLAELFEDDEDFTILDFGCGLCHFYEFLLNKDIRLKHYTGVEINNNLIKQAIKKHPGIDIITGSVDEAIENNQNYDYVVASGVYNIGETISSTQNFFKKQFEKLFPNVNKGFAVNFLSSYSDNKDQESIYHNPSDMLNMCYKNFGKNIVLNHHYLPHDFTIFVYKK